MRGLLVGVVGILVLTAGLVIAVRHLFRAEPGRREAAIMGTMQTCDPAATARHNARDRSACDDATGHR